MTMRSSLFLALAALLATSTPVSAQTTTTGIASIYHADDSTNTQPIVVGGVSNWYVNRGDCGVDAFPSANVAEIRLNVGTLVASGTQPQIWIGTNCLSSAARSGGSAATCHKAVGGAASGFEILNSVATLPMDALTLNTPDSTNAAYDLCATGGSNALSFFMFPASLSGDVPAAEAIEFKIIGDMIAPSTATINTTDAAGQRKVTLDWDTATDLEANSVTYFFALPGGCGSIGATDAGTDADGGVGIGFAAGALPPVGDDTYKQGEASTSGDAEIQTSALGLVEVGDTAAVGFSVRDPSGNYSVLSNIVCVSKIQTYGLCGSAEPGSADCPRGCAISPLAAPSAGVLVLLGLAVAGLMFRRRGVRQ